MGNIVSAIRNRPRGLLLLVFFGITVLCAAEGMIETATKGNEKAELSYAFGMLVALDLADTGFDFNYDSFIRGFRDQMEDGQTRYDIDEALEIIQSAYESAQMEMAGRNLIEGQAFLAANGGRQGVITTPSGLQFELIFEGSGEIPTIADTVRVHYHGTTIDGNVFDSTYFDGMPIELPLDRVIQGWSEGLRMMSEGSRAILYIPPDLAYGEWGAGQVIGPNATIIFEVELLNIVRPSQ